VSEIDRSAGIVIKQLRQAKGMTQDQMSSDIDLSRASLANIEQGKQSISLKRLFYFSYYFGIDPKKMLKKIQKHQPTKPN